MGQVVINRPDTDDDKAGVGDIRVTVRDLETESGGKWMKCDGSVVSKSSYPELWQLLPFRVDRTPSVKNLNSGCNYNIGAVFGKGKYAVAVWASAPGTTKILYSDLPSGPWSEVAVGTNAFYPAGLSFANDYFILCGRINSKPSIFYASDVRGPWVSASAGSADASVKSIVYANGYYVGVGGGTTAPGGYRFYSNDIKGPWTVINAGIAMYEGIAFINGNFIAYGTSSSGYTCPRFDYTTNPSGHWESKEVGTTYYGTLKSIIYKNGMYIGVCKLSSGNNFVIVYAKNIAEPWTFITIGSDSAGHYVFSDGNKIVALGLTLGKLSIQYADNPAGPWSVKVYDLGSQISDGSFLSAPDGGFVLMMDGVGVSTAYSVSGMLPQKTADPGQAYIKVKD